MANRREFLQLSAATLGIMAAPVKALAGVDPSQVMPFQRVIYDERYEECLAFASAARAMGARTRGIREDVTELWYGDLRGELARNPGLIAGLTSASSAFLMELLGHDVFHHQVFKGEHKVNAGRLEAYRFEVPGYIAEHTSRLQTADRHWSIALAQLMSNYDHKLPSYPRTQVKSHQQSGISQPDLVSWVIAPLNRG